MQSSTVSVWEASGCILALHQLLQLLNHRLCALLKVLVQERLTRERLWFCAILLLAQQMCLVQQCEHVATLLVLWFRSQRGAGGRRALVSKMLLRFVVAFFFVLCTCSRVSSNSISPLVTSISIIRSSVTSLCCSYRIRQMPSRQGKARQSNCASTNTGDRAKCKQWVTLHHSSDSNSSSRSTGAHTHEAENTVVVFTCTKRSLTTRRTSAAECGSS